MLVPKYEDRLDECLRDGVGGKALDFWITGTISG